MTPKQYLASLKEPHKADVVALDRLIRKTAPKLAPGFMAGMLSYGTYHYKGKNGRDAEWFRVGLCSRKNYISLYVIAYDQQGSLAERFKKRLPKAKIGKSCVTFKRLADLDPKALAELIRFGQNPILAPSAPG